MRRVRITMTEKWARGPCDTRKCDQPAMYMGRSVDLQLCPGCYKRFLEVKDHDNGA